MARAYLSATLMFCIIATALIVVSKSVTNPETAGNPTPVGKQGNTQEKERASTPEMPLYDYKQLRHGVMTGRASLADARRLMTDPDPASLSNSIHSFYTMRRHRGVIHLLDGMWNKREEKYPELNWEAVAKPPARIALASTINRISVVGTDMQKTYIRAHKSHPHEFVRAQVVVALGFNGEVIDLPYLREMCDGDNHYVAQSAITGLSLFGGEKAKNILIEMGEKHVGTPRGNLIYEMLQRGYHWSPAKAQ
ncbi:MAG: HEAT repeat domain-containing protein [Gammaproteobacteria bacterium]